MNKLALSTALALFATPLLADVPVRNWSRSLDLDSAGTLSLDLPVAEVYVDGDDVDRVEIEIRATCERRSGRCADYADGLSLETRTRGDRLEVRLEGWPRSGRHQPELEIRVAMPRDRDLHLDLGVGEINIAGVEGNITVDSGVGEVEIRVPEHVVGSVYLDTGIGEADLRPRPPQASRSGFLGQEVVWRAGRGSSRVSVDVGVGEIDVRLN